MKRHYLFVNMDTFSNKFSYDNTFITVLEEVVFIKNVYAATVL